MSDAFMSVCLHVVMSCHVECRGGRCTLVRRTGRLPRKKKNVFFFLVLGKISLLFFWFVLPDSMSSVGSFYSESRQLIQEK